MQLGDIIRAKKFGVEIGDWKSGKMRPSEFRLRGKFSGGSAWIWRIITFEALSREFRILIRLNREKIYYSAILCLESDSASQIICHHEIHKGHRNWHCHFIVGDVKETHPNVLRDKERMRVFDASPSREIGDQFDINEVEALAHALKRFHIPPPASDERQSEFSL